MRWRNVLKQLAERTNPFLADLAIGLAMLVVLMAAAEHFASQQVFTNAIRVNIPVDIVADTNFIYGD